MLGNYQVATQLVTSLVVFNSIELLIADYVTLNWEYTCEEMYNG
jgi:hypothetical protein